jgi:hypothetical protein
LHGVVTANFFREEVMRRTLIAALALLVACGTGDQTDDAMATREVSLEDFAGAWAGDVMREGSDNVVAHVELLATGREDGWSFTTVSASNPLASATTPARVTAVGGDSVVVEAGPFASVLREGEMVNTHAVYRLENGQLTGVVHATYPASGETIPLRMTGRRR